MKSTRLAFTATFSLAALAQGWDGDEWVFPRSQPGSESIYQPDPAPLAGGGAEAPAALSTSLSAGWASESVFRGIRRTGEAGRGGSNFPVSASLRLGDTVRPFADAWANANTRDEESPLQELRLAAGVEFGREVTVAAGVRSYVFPGRSGRNTNEVFAQVQIDDRAWWGTERPVLSPHVLIAWDPDAADGGYAEIGAEHSFELPLPQLALVAWTTFAYTHELRDSFAYTSGGTGFQHVELGAELRYRLNPLLNLPRAAGELTVSAQLAHSQHLQRQTLGEDVTWAAVHLQWKR
jgi:hypothetical protein